MRLELENITAQPPLTQDAASAVASEAKEALENGIKAAQAGDRPRARISLLRATELEPRNENAWLWLASISEYPEELLVFLNNVLDINPRNERALEWTAATRSLMAKTFVQRGIDAVQEKRPDFATECFNKALEYDQQNVMAWLWMASLSDSHEGKITYLEKVLEIDPENAEARDGLLAAKQAFNDKLLGQAKAAAVSGSKADALEFVDAIIAESPDCVDAWHLRCHLVDSFDEKIRCFDRILDIDPNNTAASSGRDSLRAIFSSAPSAANGLNGPVAEYVLDSEPHLEDTPTEKSPTQDLEVPAAFAEEFPEFVEESSSVMDEPTESFVPGAQDTAVAAVQEQTLEPLAAPSVSEKAFRRSDDDAFMADDEGISTTYPSDVVSDHYSPDFPTLSAFEEPGLFVNPVAEAFGDDNEFLFTRSSEPFPFESIPMPGNELPEAEPKLTGFETVIVRPEDKYDVTEDKLPCPFCGQPNPPQAVSCHSCLSVLTLADLEMLLANQHADKFVLRESVGRMESERAMGELSESELITLAVGHLNLRNLQFGLECLQEASKRSPNNFVLSGQVNALLIRLNEIRRQDEVHDRMPKGKKILVVDDSPTVRKLISGKLEKCGHEVFCSNDGVEAMERLETMVPDLILLDITMPRMDGYQVCKLIRSSPATKDVPVVMISGKDGFFDKVRGRMAGTTGYITKPFGPETLMKAVEIYLRGEVQPAEQ